MTGLAFDPAVPHRDALLGAPDVLGPRFGACAPLHVKYRFGESLRVAYRCAAGIAALRTGAHPGAFAQLPDLGASVWLFPRDRRLAALPRLADPRALGCARTRIVAYAPERSATAACLSGDGDVVAYAKAQAPGAAAAERRLTRAVRAALDPDVRVPRVLGGDGGVIVLEALPGRRLDALGPDALSRLGAALAILHTLPAPETRFARLDAPRLATAADVLRRARPDVAAAATRLLARLDAAADDGRREPVCLHGDAHLRNAIRLADGRIGLIDLEHVSAGAAAADLGQLLAGLMAARRPGGRALLAGYESVAPLPDRAALRWHTAASLLARVALPAVSRVRPEILGQLPALLAIAADLVAPSVRRRTEVAA